MRRLGQVRGVVQGVGFRPFVARLADDLGLAGRVRNEGRAVVIAVEGERAAVEGFARRLEREAPAAARIEHIEWADEAPQGEQGFRIEESATEGAPTLTIPADLRACADCLAETDDPAARRHDYPFTNCTACGPRFTLARALPWDRARTSMDGFAVCEACRGEYADPSDRRYHAEPIACPACGPRIALRDARGAPLAEDGRALDHAAELLRRGEILALKGLGGYQLLCDARDEAAVQRLRARKRRGEKPVAVMVPGLQEARALALLGALEEEALQGSAGPIVLARARGDRVAPSVACRSARVGLLLPTTPLHHRLLRRLGAPVVCTSGNLHDDPIAVDDGDALTRLGPIADAFLTHDRPIVRRCDDAVVHVVDGRVRALRLGRGIAPVRVALGGAGPPLLCLGSHLKNAPAAVVDGEAVLWPHVGDLDTLLARRAFEEAIAALCAFLALAPAWVVSDAHPDYGSTRWADRSELPVLRVQHHHAHVAACLAEHGEHEALGVAWDGTGLGDDGTAWGGEFLHVTPAGARRVARLRSFPLPGGDAAARDGRRALAGLCVEAGLPLPDGGRELADFAAVARAPRLSPRTSSAGRLFDAVAALTGLCARSDFEGQAAMMLEHAAAPGAPPYPLRLQGGVLDWAPMLAAMLEERHDAPRVASRFHATLATAIAAIAARADLRNVALAGGCFQNVLLVELAAAALSARGLRVLVPTVAPPGDGGLALGQAWAATRHLMAG
jgi:hydrogenase maturation protein HypF